MTMTTLLSNKQADALRSIGDSAMVLFALWMIDQNYPGRMTKPRELLPYLYPIIKDLRKLETQLNALCASGRIAQTTAGYVLIEGGKALLLGMAENEINALALSPVTNTAGTETNAQALNEAISGELSTTHIARTSRKIDKREEDLTFKNSSSDSVLEIAQNVQSEILPKVVGIIFEDGTPIYQMECIGGYVTTREILDATEELEDFGYIAANLPVDAIKPELALAWIAKAWDDRSTLRFPPGALVVSRLRDIEQPKPPRKYFKNPTQYLPDEYCEVLRLAKYSCKSCMDGYFSTQAAFDDHVHTFHIVKLEEMIESCAAAVEALDSGHVGSKAWVSVVEQLQMEMPRASFDTWVRATQPVKFDGTVLTVAVRKAYARDWLESRLESTVNRMLETIMNQYVTVRFVVAQIEDDGDGEK